MNDGAIQVREIMNAIANLYTLGDMVDFPFLRAVVGSSFFHVSHVHHEFDGDTQTITIWLESGEYNIYKRFSEDKEAYEREDRWRKQIVNGNI